MMIPFSKKFSRRGFLKTTALAAGALSLPARSWAQVPGANQDIRMAVVGFNGRGQDHIKAWSKIAGARLVALCDADRKVLDAGVANCANTGLPVQGYTDIRKLLDSREVDAISIATPNHWHALAGVWGMQAGKDVYVEKPVSYDIWEGQQLVAAAKKYNKIVQAGTQSRSSSGIRDAVNWVQKMHLGKILRARAICYKPRGSIGKTDGPQKPPESVDYDLWTGPAPLHPPHRARFHYDWHWFWDYGAGDLGNQGVHEMDVARWFLGEQMVSPRTLTVGGRFGYEDDAETPNTVLVFHDYYTAPLIMEVRGLPEKTGSRQMDNQKGVTIGVIVECEGGYVTVKDYGSATAYDKDGKEVKKFTGTSSHYENFLGAVRSRSEAALNANITEGHRSTALCHLANISYRIGTTASPQAIREQIQGDKEHQATLDRMTEHLAANGVDLEKTPARLGMALKTNPMTEKIVQNKPANHLWRRVPRKGYEIKIA